MASKEELEAIGIKKFQCKECCRDITEEEYKAYKGYCKNCYGERKNIERRKEIYNNENNESENIEEFEDNGKNIVASIIKGIAVISAIAGVIVGLVSIDALNSGVIAAVIIISSIISSIFIYALGEIIQLLEDIKNK